MNWGGGDRWVGVHWAELGGVAGSREKLRLQQLLLLSVSVPDWGGDGDWDRGEPAAWRSKTWFGSAPFIPNPLSRASQPDIVTKRHLPGVSFPTGVTHGAARVPARSRGPSLAWPQQHHLAAHGGWQDPCRRPRLLEAPGEPPGRQGGRAGQQGGHRVPVPTTLGDNGVGGESAGGPGSELMGLGCV